VVADEFKADAQHQTVSVNAIPDGWRIMDIGPDSLDTFREALRDCKTVFWNGPVGVAEFPAFAEGSYALAMELADMDARVVIGGGETAALVEQAGLHDRFTHVSTGGRSAFGQVGARSPSARTSFLEMTQGPKGPLERGRRWT
jgi:phosphoglycerate kinase